MGVVWLGGSGCSGVGYAQAEVLAVVDGLIEQHRDVVVVQGVDDPLSGARPAQETAVARIVAMVEQASATKAKTQLFIEKIEQRYSIGMVTATVALFVIPLLWGAELQSTLLRAMTFMIVASPCAVVLATMPPLLCAMANAGRHGVLVKSAVVMEQLGQASRVAFDKTGTLTAGTPRLTDIRPLVGSGLSDDELLSLAAAVEYPSEHPLAGAVVAAARDRDLALASGSRSARRRACWMISSAPPVSVSPQWCPHWSRPATPPCWSCATVSRLGCSVSPTGSARMPRRR